MKKNMWQVKPIKMHFNLDSDRDGVSDHRDCRPFNPRMQHISKTQKRRVQKLGVAVVPERDEYWMKDNQPYLIPIGKKSKKLAPRATQEVYSIFHRHPELIGRMENVKQQWRQRWIKDKQHPKNKLGEPLGDTLSYTSWDAQDDEDRSSPLDFASYGGGIQVLGPKKFSKESRDRMAYGLHHELTHEEQALADPQMHKKYDEYAKDVGKPPTPMDVKSPEFIEWAGRYNANPYEVEANKEAKRMMKKRYGDDWDEDYTKE